MADNRANGRVGHLPEGWTVCTRSPGDGKTRYAFFLNAPEGQTFSGPKDAVYVALGLREASAYAAGLRHRAPLSYVTPR